MAVAAIFKPLLGFVRAELIANCILVAIVLIVVALRVTGRVCGPGLGFDDGFVIVATPLGVAMLVCQGLMAPVGNGYSLPENPELAANIPYILQVRQLSLFSQGDGRAIYHQDILLTLSQLTFCMQIIYVTLLASVKASMLCFFIRIFPTNFMQRASKITLGFIGAWWISYLCACIFLCNPISAQWTYEGTCGAYMPMIQSLIATNAVGDLVIMALPMHSIWSLNTRTTDKIGITSCFALGLACVVCAIFRLIYISTVDLTTNITGTMPSTVFLFILEPNLAILCVSIPMLRPFWMRYKKTKGGSKLQEITDDSTGGYRNKSNNSGLGSRRPIGSQNPELETTWEMENYQPYIQGKTDASVSAAYADESGSEKNLTAVTMPKDAIGVETKWTVTHT
ncbi:hypothetical protein F4775DRAFT_314008 [Biscogniauxia sp. FL1348]|nr:hypothetical protein F4775DRAFT_314008 [Biscogniauxia sp. FL1348]